MSDPFRIDGPAIVSFSGGRTSGYMLRRVLDALGGSLPPDVHVCFANTGKEHPSTLDFVDECARQWDAPIHWLEYRRTSMEEPPRTVEVQHASASRSGEPFDQLLACMSRDEESGGAMLPNSRDRFCSQEMKARTVKRWARGVAGFPVDFDMVIGIRADEPVRIAKNRKPTREGYGRVMPLADVGVNVEDVGAFWRAQPFDLALPNRGGVTIMGNCDLCFLKRDDRRVEIIRHDPTLATWWTGHEKRTGKHFSPQHPSYAALARFARDQVRLSVVPDDDLAGSDCMCVD